MQKIYRKHCKKRSSLSLLTYLSATQLIKKIKSKEVSCVEVMQAHFDQIAKVNNSLNALVQQLSLSQALREARKADEAIQKKETVGPLHGLPITVKDCCYVQGFVPQVGSVAYRDAAVSTIDATVISRLRAAGGIIIGITNVPEFLTAFETDNDLYGRTNNPYDLMRTPGGSSGGEAAIIAAAGSPLGIASDGAGSIRQPAHNTGITGLKPTHGLIPKTGSFPSDAVGLMRQITTFGPMARFIDDLMLVLPLLAGADSFDPYVMPVALRNFHDISLKSLRVAFYINNELVIPSSDTRQVIERVVHALEKEVCSIEEKYPSDLKRASELVGELFLIEGDKAKGLMDFLSHVKLKKPSAILQQFLLFSQQYELSVTALRKRLIETDQIRINMKKFMNAYDLLICPVAAIPACLHGDSQNNWNNFTYTPPYNLLGWPVAVVRCGTSSEGLPIAVQCIAKPWRDDIALAAAKKIEDMFGGWQMAKQFHNNVFDSNHRS